ncbi:hypothetical protein pdam_00011725, partial [Pocillopora damicornis]
MEVTEVNLDIKITQLKMRIGKTNTIVETGKSEAIERHLSTLWSLGKELNQMRIEVEAAFCPSKSVCQQCHKHHHTSSLQWINAKVNGRTALDPSTVQVFNGSTPRSMDAQLSLYSSSLQWINAKVNGRTDLALQFKFSMDQCQLTIMIALSRLTRTIPKPSASPGTGLACAVGVERETGDRGRQDTPAFHAFDFKRHGDFCIQPARLFSTQVFIPSYLFKGGICCEVVDVTKSAFYEAGFTNRNLRQLVPLQVEVLELGHEGSHRVHEVVDDIFVITRKYLADLKRIIFILNNRLRSQIVYCGRVKTSKAKIRRALLGKVAVAAQSLPSPRTFFAFLCTKRLFTTISESGTGTNQSQIKHTQWVCSGLSKT